MPPQSKGKSLIAENLELAYKTWRECGQSPEATVKKLTELGFSLSRQTIYDWMEKYNWKERATRAEMMEQKITTSTDNLQSKFLHDLIVQKERYDGYFETIAPQIDNQAIYAYTNLVKVIAEIDRKKIVARTAGEIEKKLGADVSKEKLKEVVSLIYGINS